MDTKLLRTGIFVKCECVPLCHLTLDEISHSFVSLLPQIKGPEPGPGPHMDRSFYLFPAYITWIYVPSRTLYAKYQPSWSGSS